MLAGTVPRERMKPVAGQIGKFFEALGRVEQGQSPHCPLLDVGRKAPTMFAIPDRFGLPAGEAADHPAPPDLSSFKLSQSVSFGRFTSQNNQPFTPLPVIE
jgi:hypothetical protein